MKITKTELKKIIQEELLKEFGSEEYGLQTKEFEPIPEVEFQVGDEVDVLGSVLAGAVGEVIEVTRTETGVPAIVLRLLRAAHREVYGGEGDEVIVPSFTIISCLSAIVRSEAKPVFCDVDPLTWNMNLDEVKKVTTKNTKAVLLVHTYGLPSPATAIEKFCIDNNPDISLIPVPEFPK